MAEYHVGAGLFCIYAGTLNKSKTMWQNKTECTDEALCAVRDYLKSEADSQKRNRAGYEWTLIRPVVISAEGLSLMALMPVSMAGSMEAAIAISVSGVGPMLERISPAHGKLLGCWQMNRCAQERRCATLSLIAFGRGSQKQERSGTICTDGWHTRWTYLWKNATSDTSTLTSSGGRTLS